MIWTLIAFAITFFVLKKFAFGPIQKTIDDRRDRIRQTIEEARDAQALLVREGHDQAADATAVLGQSVAELRAELDELARTVEQLKP